MLFNSPEFILIFLPLVFIGFIYTSRIDSVFGQYWLLFFSLLFYAWWSIGDLIILTILVGVNFFFGMVLQKRLLAPITQFWILFCSISSNIIVLFYFKYAAFFLSNLFGIQVAPYDNSLPLGISFFTFTQIAYLVDIYSGKTKEKSLRKYALFVSFFPHLIAGPIVHHRQLTSQFGRHVKHIDIAVGLSNFCIGLAKKVIIADNLGGFVNLIFSASDAHLTLSFLEAWLGALAYTFQIYFDFSGYSDMAIGLARIFGIRFPANFSSPYKSTSIIDFWQRWHITLSFFLRDYLFQPIALSLLRSRQFLWDANGSLRRYMSVVITMVLGGLWHGANWTFLLWGIYHGILIVVNHLWRDLFGVTKIQKKGFKSFFQLSTFILVVISFVFFRSKTVSAAFSMLKSMFFIEDLISFYGDIEKFEFSKLTILFPNHLFSIYDLFPWLLLALVIAFFTPNTQQIMKRFNPVLNSGVVNESTEATKILWRPTLIWAVAMGGLLLISVTSLTRVSSFLYYQF